MYIYIHIYILTKNYQRLNIPIEFWSLKLMPWVKGLIIKEIAFDAV